MVGDGGVMVDMWIMVGDGRQRRVMVRTVGNGGNGG